MTDKQFANFEKKVMPALDGCWYWIGNVDRKGYGRVRHGTRTVLVHRASFEHFRSAIPGHLQVDHRCCNTSCVNPNHLEAVTSQVNNIRKTARIIACPRGHPYSPENTGITRKTHRYCKACRQINNHKYRSTRNNNE